MIKDLSLALTEYENNDTLRCAVIFAHGDHFTEYVREFHG
jgi:enoyl-CoA hydratase